MIVHESAPTPDSGAPIQVLSQLTDAQLAERGLKREEVPQAALNCRAHA